MLLQKLELPADLVEAGLSVLDALPVANEGRNAAVHSHWLHLPEGPDGAPVLQALKKSKRGQLGWTPSPIPGTKGKPRDLVWLADIAK
jgi:hypothetical protein